MPLLCCSTNVYLIALVALKLRHVPCCVLAVAAGAKWRAADYTGGELRSDGPGIVPRIDYWMMLNKREIFTDERI